MSRNRDDALLKSVSRSFYLSIRFLPPAMREPIALGYLLARLTDTIADAPGLPLDRRLELLEAIRIAIRDEDSQPEIRTKDVATAVDHPGERELLSRIDHLFGWYASLDAANRIHLCEVILTIIQGQTWDVTYFPTGGFTACESSEDLLRYTYQVAGSVGEYWTKVGFTNLGERFADPHHASSMLVSGRKLGQALQLINILRDLHEDLPAGRCYLPADELKAAGWNGEGAPPVETLGPVFDSWLGMCRGFLEDADSYIVNVRDFRVRFCTRLPRILAEGTADCLANAGIERVISEKVKLPRSAVWKAMARGVFF